MRTQETVLQKSECATATTIYFHIIKLYIIKNTALQRLIQYNCLIVTSCARYLNTCPKHEVISLGFSPAPILVGFFLLALLPWLRACDGDMKLRCRDPVAHVYKVYKRIDFSPAIFNWLQQRFF